MQFFFVSDLHGKLNRYQKLFSIIRAETPDAVLFGGDLLPHGMWHNERYTQFSTDFLFAELKKLQAELKDRYPTMLLILGNDDPRSEESIFMEHSKNGLFHYINQTFFQLGDWSIFGYSFVPPTPFQLKDWEKYDVSRYADPGCIHPTEGFRTVNPPYDTEYSTIQKDLKILTEGKTLDNSIFLFHSPPYKTNLDRAALDGKMFDYVPMDIHVGSIAIQRFIEEKQPAVTLHGHIHESTRITGTWKEMFGKTWAMNGSHDGPELSIIRFNPKKPGDANLELI